MKRFFLILFFLSLLAQVGDVCSQTVTWQRTYDGGSIDYGYSIVQTPDEGYIAVGRKRVQSNNYSFAMRLNKFGDTIWTKTYPGFESKRIIKTSDNYYIISSRYSLFKIDIQGNEIWTKPGIEDVILESNDGGFFGCHESSLRKFNSLGDTIWNRNYSYLVNGYFHDFDINSNNEFEVVGSFISNLLNQGNRFLMKMNLNGDFISINNFYWERIPFIIVSNDLYSFVVASDSRPQLAKFDSTGKIIWDKIYYGNFPEYSQTNDFIKTYDNGFILTGIFHSGNFNYFVLIIKVDSAGNEQWRKLYGFGDHDEGLCIKQISDSGFVIVGIRDNFQLGDIYIIKTDKTGYADPPVSINNLNSNVISGYNLFQNYPNPFNPNTTISFLIPKNEYLELNLYNSKGSLIRSILKGNYPSGIHNTNFNGNDLTSGIYYCRLKTTDFVKTIKLILIK